MLLRFCQFFELLRLPNMALIRIASTKGNRALHKIRKRFLLGKVEGVVAGASVSGEIVLFILIFFSVVFQLYYKDHKAETESQMYDTLHIIKQLLHFG